MWKHCLQQEISRAKHRLVSLVVELSAVVQLRDALAHHVSSQLRWVRMIRSTHRSNMGMELDMDMDMDMELDQHRHTLHPTPSSSPMLAMELMRLWMGMMKCCCLVIDIVMAPVVEVAC